jgi:hypothetical protein
MPDRLLPRAGKRDISELFGYAPADSSAVARRSREDSHCPFLRDACDKTSHDGTPLGVCTVSSPQIGETIICPNRLYFDNYRVLADVSEDAFGGGCTVIHPDALKGTTGDGRQVVALGHRYGNEVPVPVAPGQHYSTDWILALIGNDGKLSEFVGVEVQAIDTTQNYRDARSGYLAGNADPPSSQHGLNWENVNKRIIPQVVYKGRVLNRETLCRRGLYLITPEGVYQRIIGRLGGEVQEYPPGRGSVTFMRYRLTDDATRGKVRPVELVGVTRTNVETVATQFVGARPMPEPNLLSNKISEVLGLKT